MTSLNYGKRFGLRPKYLESETARNDIVSQHILDLAFQLVVKIDSMHGYAVSFSALGSVTPRTSAYSAILILA